MLGLGHLAYPFGGDQALFAVGALDLSRGAVLYQDFWDFKQPGIFAFYYAAGRLFGFDETGIHAFELAWMLALSVVIMLAMRGWRPGPLAAIVAPVLTVGHYYAVSESWHLTQVEGLVGLPMLLALWLASTPDASARTTRLYASGVMGGVVLLFKLMFLPILVAFWLTALVTTIRRQESPGRRSVVVVATIVAGVLSPLLATLAYFAWHDALGVTWWTWFDFPRLALEQIPAPSPWRLVGALEWFAARFSWMVALAVLGAVASARRRADAMAWNLIWWCGLGVVVVLAQVQSWWPYHFLLLFVPLGMLAAIGIDTLWTWIRQADASMATRGGAAALLAALIVLPSPTIGLVARKAVALVEARGALSSETRLRFQQDVSKGYVAVLGEVGFLREPDSLPGRIYVFGDPLYHFLSGRGQAISLNGWFMEMALADQWRQIATQLDAARPPYIFVANGEADLVSHSPEVTSLLRQAYRPFRKSQAGSWYVRTTSTQRAEPPGLDAERGVDLAVAAACC